jgi:hypothetical protein
VKDEAKKFAMPVSGQVSRRLFRTGWAGIVATVTAGGLLFTASANDPSRPLPDGDGELSAERHVPFRAEPVDQARTVPAGVSLDQIEAVLERAENLARRQGPDFSPTVAQAAAELGMLYTTYQVQLRASGEQPARQPVLSAVPVSAVRTVAGEQAAAEGPDAADAELGRVTYDQVVVAAVRLASMLDQTTPGSSVDVQRTDEFRDSVVLVGPAGPRQREGSTLRSNLLDVVTVFRTSTLVYANGRIPTAVLCPLKFAPGHMLRCDAAERLTALSESFEREFGYPIPITDSYRSYVEQIAVAAAKPHLAAVPGTSNHGWGLAVDLSDPISGGTSREYAWLRVHGPDHGWDNPSWARPGGTKPEPWHFEFFAAGSIPDRAVDPSDVGGWSDAPSSSAAASDPRSIPALDPGENPTVSRPRSPATPDEPSTSPPSQKPAKPGAKPKPTPGEPKPKPTPKPAPSDPAPKPTTPPATPSPTPTPSPSEPGQEPPVSPSPTPVPSPSEPSQEPSAPPPAPPAESSPSPDPAPSAAPSSVPAPPPEGESRTSPAPSSAPSSSASSAPLPEPDTNG